MENIDDLLKGGYSIDSGDMFETLLTLLYSNHLALGEILREQLTVKELLQNREVDSDDINKQLIDRGNLIAEQATKLKNEWIATMHSKRK